MGNRLNLPTAPGCQLHTLELGVAHAPLLQALFDANPAYFLAVQGEPAGPGEALEEIAGALPQGISIGKKWVIGYADANGQLVAMANLLADIFVPGVWNLSTFMLATEHHGRGTAQTLYHALERWVQAQGAQWLRLGVVQGYTRAERFWQRCGYHQTRLRHDYLIGSRLNTLRVLCKPLGGGKLDDYLALVPRDRP